MLTSRYNKITSKQVIGWFYEALDTAVQSTWLDQVSSYFTSDQAAEEYPWLGAVPKMREAVGGRQAITLPENSLVIRNKHYEATIDFAVSDLRRDKTGQVKQRIAELADQSVLHFTELLSDAILLSESTLSYDGQYHADTDHLEGNSGTQSNLISTDISALPTIVHGTTTAPSPEELQQAIIKSINQLIGLKDDRGRAMNNNARSFVVMVPVSLWVVAMNSQMMPNVAGTSVQMTTPAFSVSVVPNANLSTWTDKFIVFRTDARTKAFIRQEETPLSLKVKAEGSDYEFDFDAHQYGVDTWRGVGNGRWQNLVINQLV
jgi:phage major head subunit gpT-like protein